MNCNNATTVSIFLAGACERNHNSADSTGTTPANYRYVDLRDNKYLIGFDCQAFGEIRSRFSPSQTG